jgi:hypothetical protein
MTKLSRYYYVIMYVPIFQYLKPKHSSTASFQTHDTNSNLNITLMTK